MAGGQEPLLAEGDRRLHRALVDAFLEAGIVPIVSELAGRLGTTVDAVRGGLGALAAADYLALDDGLVVCLYPFSARPTPHVVVVDGRRRSAMCAVDALGVPALMGCEVPIESRCALCGTPIRLRVRPRVVVTAEPETALVVARRDEAEPAVTACCPFTVFVCGQNHAALVAGRVSGTSMLALDAALVHAETLFGDLLAPTLPASRRRGRQWDGPHGR